MYCRGSSSFFFFQAEDGIRDWSVTGVQTCALPISTIKRRILRRMLILKINRMEKYLTYLQTSPSELNSLFQDILINVTAFFREPATLEALKTEIFPNILKNRTAEDHISIRIHGWSTGDTSYSVAMNPQP